MKRQKGKKKNQAKERVFGCDLVTHLETSGQEVPQVLKSCSQFIEEHGIVDGIYRLSGISSNIQKLRQEFDTEKTADLTKDVYLQDIHCVSSLCKAYFRELPNPLLMYQLYDKFADAVNTQLEEDRLLKICSVLKDLPPGHYRTLEFLMRHLLRMASHSSKTNMHARNLAIVWAPNLLRSKEIESSGFNGTAAFMEVRVQSIVVEFILNHVEQLFDHKNLTPVPGVDSDDRRKSLPSPSSAPNLLNESSGHRILASQIPHIVHMGDGPPAIRPYHSIIELPENRRKGSLKVKKWKSIFNLGKSGTDSKRKASRNDERGQYGEQVGLTEVQVKRGICPFDKGGHNNSA
ncbi:rho GTPase-activating protein 30 [Rhincodon typus]|uniref:rho GTPase-activating protein 30 n=1 Tax=Rhincodon typus TaxID=259920 RepID=UPI00202EC626|nr:rho GTPase-activating protein 30 [Rhincodon typus]